MLRGRPGRRVSNIVFLWKRRSPRRGRPKERSCFFQFSAFPPEGPWDPFVFAAACLIASAVMTSKITGWGRSGGSPVRSKASSTTGAGSNCSALRLSTTSSTRQILLPGQASKEHRAYQNLRCKGACFAFSLSFLCLFCRASASA